MADILEIRVNKIKPDPKQPRSYINMEKVKEMAASMKIEGVINPIEIDEDNTIITGELRWRAAKEAGLTTVPCIRREIDGRNRYRRQLIENIHNNSMSAIDTARAIKKLLEHHEGTRDEAIAKLVTEIGTSRVFIMEHLDILNTIPEIKERIKNKVMPRTITRAINVVPEEKRDAFQEKIVKEKLGRDAAVSLSKAINLHPDKAEELMEKDYTGMSFPQISIYLNEEAPTLSQHIADSNEVERDLHRHIEAIIKWMAENNLEDLGPVYQALIKQDFRILSRNVSVWAQKQGLLDAPDERRRLK